MLKHINTWLCKGDSEGAQMACMNLYPIIQILLYKKQNVSNKDKHFDVTFVCIHIMKKYIWKGKKK